MNFQGVQAFACIPFIKTVHITSVPHIFAHEHMLYCLRVPLDTDSRLIECIH